MGRSLEAHRSARPHHSPDLDEQPRPPSTGYAPRGVPIAVGVRAGNGAGQEASGSGRARRFHGERGRAAELAGEAARAEGASTTDHSECQAAQMSGRLQVRSSLYSNICSLPYGRADLGSERSGLRPADRGVTRPVRGTARRRPGHHPGVGRRCRALPPCGRHHRVEPNAAVARRRSPRIEISLSFTHTHTHILPAGRTASGGPRASGVRVMNGPSMSQYRCREPITASWFPP